ncbi:helix-turn-helix domain-containing protein [Nonomuraea sp. NBC_01738]|uniref:helix-turn-helix domain-containing protein n=1 Tax=Nonomuraea sp. NBC_01738 TaxID=2976003 RepID=UPI002E12E6D7|nr:helix-turn-helix domain-containing protein [Nonomuraea sp. NBC_01738]
MQEQSIGSTLATARRSAGLTVGQLSATTRIREALIYAIERDDFSLCGGDFYARGHIKSIARGVGLDPETMVHLYDEQHGGVPMPVRAATVFQTERRVKLRERRGPNWTMALGVALAIVVVFGVVRVMGGSGELPAAEVKQASAVPSVPPNTPFTEPPVVKPVKPVVVAKKDLVVVRIKAKRSSYLNVRDAEGRKLFAGTLHAGKSSTWRAASEVNLLIGDAGAVSLQVNGRNLGRPGSSGEMVRRTFGPSMPRPR